LPRRPFRLFLTDADAASGVLLVVGWAEAWEYAAALKSPWLLL
jgi:hypothetical protein